MAATGAVAADSSGERLHAYGTTALNTALLYLLTKVIAVELDGVTLWWNKQEDHPLARVVEDLSHLVQRAGLSGVAILIVANIVFVTGWTLALRGIFEAWALWAKRVRAILRPILREIINAEATRSAPLELHTKSTQGLADREIADRWIERNGAKRILNLATNLGATAIAVSGHRGAGKTTLLRHALNSIKTPEVSASKSKKQSHSKPLSIFVEAPVDYAPRDFLIDLFSQLCEAVLAASSGNRFRARTRIGHVALRVARAVIRTIVFIVALALLWGFSEDDPTMPRTTELFAAITNVVGLDDRFSIGAQTLIIICLMVMFIALGYIENGGDDDLSRRARSELSQLRYLQTLQNERTLSGTRVGLTFGIKNGRQLSQQPITIPELVRRYRTFAAAVASSPPKNRGAGLLIAIDEMDRISNAQGAEGLLNQIKATFDVPGCIYFVTVSEEALAQFERRIATARRALDTAFDEVVWLPEFNVTESLSLLRRRVVGFPDTFLVLCHCLAGGIPRDLVRSARSLVDARVRIDDVDLTHITHELLRAEIAAHVRGVLRDLQNTTGSPVAVQPASLNPGDNQLLEILLSRTPFDDMTGLRQDLEPLVTQDVTKAISLLAALEYYAIVERVFIDHHHVATGAVADPVNDDYRSFVESVAAVRTSLPISPKVARQRMEELRKDLALIDP